MQVSMRALTHLNKRFGASRKISWRSPMRKFRTGTSCHKFHSLLLCKEKLRYALCVCAVLQRLTQSGQRRAIRPLLYSDLHTRAIASNCILLLVKRWGVTLRFQESTAGWSCSFSRKCQLGQEHLFTEYVC
jgi:hypothetical protein